MYKHATEKKVPFFEWPKWIEGELDRVYLNYIYRRPNRVKKLIEDQTVNVMDF